MAGAKPQNAESIDTRGLRKPSTAPPKGLPLHESRKYAVSTGTQRGGRMGIRRLFLGGNPQTGPATSRECGRQNVTMSMSATSCRARARHDSSPKVPAPVPVQWSAIRRTAHRSRRKEKKRIHMGEIQQAIDSKRAEACSVTITGPMISLKRDLQWADRGFTRL